MAQDTKIEWTDATWNPIRGCPRVSEGCRHCYAETVAYRFSGPRQAYGGLVRIGSNGERRPEWNGQIRVVPEHLHDPLRWKAGRRIFVNSMSDLFHENVPEATLDLIFAVMALCPQHTFQVLTKRPKRMLEYFNRPDLKDHSKAVTNPCAWYVWRAATAIQAAARKPIPSRLGWTTFEETDTVAPWPLPNVWLGVSVENQKSAEERIPLLLETPAAVRFLSIEPLLGPVDVDQWFIEPDLQCSGFDGAKRSDDYCDRCGGHISDPCHHSPAGLIDWVIVGGESGPGARPMHPDWVRSLRDQCAAAGVPFFFKQWGEWLPWEPEQEPCWVSQNGRSEDSHALFPPNIADNPPGWDCVLGFEGEAQCAFQRVGKKAAGHLLDGVEHHAFPEVRA